MRVLLLTSHAIAEYDDLRMLTDLGYEVFSIGGAYDDVPFEGKRPALDVTRYPEFEAACHVQRHEMSQRFGDPDQRSSGGLNNVDWAKARIHPDILDWADAIIVHHFPESWIAAQWDRFKFAYPEKRVIWRTCGQSSPDGSLERLMAPLRADGLQIVRYSPREAVLPDYAGHDAIIRFGKYPDDYGPWKMGDAFVGNVTQHMAQRGNACGLGFWQAATEGLPVKPAGPGSEELRGGIGPLDYYSMLDYLAGLRTYLYTGTQPASYTLGLMEAMLSGVPVVSIGPAAFGHGELFEAPEIVGDGWAFDEPYGARQKLQNTLAFTDRAATASHAIRQRAIDLFGMDTVGPQWKAFLG